MEHVLSESFALLKKLNDILPNKMTHKEMQECLDAFKKFEATINKLNTIQRQKISSNKEDVMHLLEKSKKSYRCAWKLLHIIQFKLIDLMDKNNFGKRREY